MFEAVQLLKTSKVTNNILYALFQNMLTVGESQPCRLKKRLNHQQLNKPNKAAPIPPTLESKPCQTSKIANKSEKKPFERPQDGHLPKSFQETDHNNIEPPAKWVSGPLTAPPLRPSRGRLFRLRPPPQRRSWHAAAGPAFAEILSLVSFQLRELNGLWKLQAI
ncbi:hypothetical protein GWI33_022421 [Rhynchophorus ferrugineus]|uniref:Uncharacterized protein n=1 Tax=Rhynchophorus ferrugineus TaxID=354439 RepID=A0A834IUJ1_RHYFE|nr:hypothetical protein GWI33_022421 [Rhynchophorus ferrugineus]